jgi:hypothetical protein
MLGEFELEEGPHQQQIALLWSQVNQTRNAVGSLFHATGPLFGRACVSLGLLQTIPKDGLRSEDLEGRMASNSTASRRRTMSAVAVFRMTLARTTHIDAMQHNRAIRGRDEGRPDDIAESMEDKLNLSRAVKRGAGLPPGRMNFLPEPGISVASVGPTRLGKLMPKIL